LIRTTDWPADLKVDFTVPEFACVFIFLTIEKSLSEWYLQPSSAGARVVSDFSTPRIYDSKTYLGESNLAACVGDIHCSHREAGLLIQGIGFVVNLPCLWS
jgi:hypothetical protein